MELNGTFLVSAISFLIFVFIMNMIFYKPLAKITDDRKKFIDGNYKEAQDAQEKSAALLADRDEKLEKSRFDAKSILNSKNTDAQTKKDKLTKKSREKSTQMVQDAKTALAIEAKATQEGFGSYVEDLADTICKKLTEK